jgi:hypothetical protein
VGSPSISAGDVIVARYVRSLQVVDSVVDSNVAISTPVVKQGCGFAAQYNRPSPVVERNSL